jgi:hypothetical protein
MNLEKTQTGTIAVIPLRRIFYIDLKRITKRNPA